MSISSPESPLPPLPEHWSTPTVFQDEVVIDGVAIARAGVAACWNDEEVTGAAAEALASPLERSRFELYERASTVEALASAVPTYVTLDAAGRQIAEIARSDVFPGSDAPARWRYARSNGIALFRDWVGACERARLELVERDRILRSWHGLTRPERIAFASSASPLFASSRYEWRAYRFPSKLGSETDHVCGVFGFPRSSEDPLAMGYAAATSLGDALERATREAIQTLAFCWGEPVLDEPQAFSPTAFFHLEHMQSPRRRPVVLRWLDEGLPLDDVARRTLPSLSGPTPSAATFVDITPSWLKGMVHVAKAISPFAVPLTFGHAPWTEAREPELRLHPIV